MIFEPDGIVPPVTTMPTRRPVVELTETTGLPALALAVTVTFCVDKPENATFAVVAALTSS